MDDQDSDTKINVSTVVLFGKQYKIIDYNKTNNKKRKYISLIVYFFNKIKNILINFYDNKLEPFLDRYYLNDYFRILIFSQIFLSILYLSALLIIFIGAYDLYVRKINICKNNYMDCDIYKKICFNNDDFIVKQIGKSMISEIRRNEINICIDNNIHYKDFVKNQTYDVIKFIANCYYYLLPLYTICFISYFVILWIKNKCEYGYYTVKNEIKHLPKIEEV